MILIIKNQYMNQLIKKISEVSIQGMSATYQFFESLPQKIKLLQSHTHTVTSTYGPNLGPIGQCHPTFKLGNKYFTDKFIVLKDLQRRLILELNWQSNYKIDHNWNLNGPQYITYNNNNIGVSMPSTGTKPIIHSAGVFYLQPRSVSAITVKKPMT